MSSGDISTSYVTAVEETGAELPSEKSGGRLEKMVRIAYDSGNVFEGTLSSRWIAQGTGSLFLSDGGITYEGQFNDGLPEGTGIVKWPDGSWYKGEFRRGLRHGYGLHVSCENGRRSYSGQWTDSKRNGPGHTSCRAGESDGALNYVGDWVDGRPHGRGSCDWSDGTRYVGDWVDSLPHGRGKVVWSNDNVYEGEFVSGLMDGTGTYEWSSNPRDGHRLIVSSCDRYIGQWSRSKRHGAGLFYSTDTGQTVHGHWTDGVLDGPCDIVLSTGRRPLYTNLTFRHNVLYGTQLPPPAVVRRNPSGPPSPAAQRGRQPTVAKRKQMRPEPAVETGYDLSGHVQRIAAKCAKGAKEISLRVTTSTTTVTVGSEPELQAAQLALNSYLDRLRDLYGTFSVDCGGPAVAYRTLMTRLGFWRMLVDCGLHVRVSLADFDELLYENKDYAFESAHDPFETVHFWQFVHAVCELATIVCDIRDARAEDTGNGSLRGVWATAFRRLLAEYLKPDVVPVSFAAQVGNDAGERWMDSRKTVETMYDVYRTMGCSPPTARRLIQLYGPRLRVGGGEPLSMESAMPTVLDTVLSLGENQTEPVTLCETRESGTMTLFGCSTESVVALLAEACPRIVGQHGLLVNMETRLVFAEWYQFILLCVRDCCRGPVPV
ncbi:MORN motif [Cinara cedri]|uniref:MORN motif n=1 Tax=Cinara cedri TaxID=506608 RepID=A0A5E4LYE1_9HEMI|nr:MORN motif [Cinara cedri]